MAMPNQYNQSLNRIPVTTEQQYMVVIVSARALRWIEKSIFKNNYEERNSDVYMSRYISVQKRDIG